MPRACQACEGSRFGLGVSGDTRTPEKPASTLEYGCIICKLGIHNKIFKLLRDGVFHCIRLSAALQSFKRYTA